MVAKNGTYGVGTAIVGVVAVGLVFHLLSNLAFLIGYCCIVVQKNRVVN